MTEVPKSVQPPVRPRLPTPQELVFHPEAPWLDEPSPKKRNTVTETKPGIQKFVWQFAGAAVNAVMLVAVVPQDQYWTEPFYLALASTGLQLASAALTYVVPNLRDMRYLKSTVALTFVLLQVLVAVIPGGITQLEIQQIATAIVSFMGTTIHSNGAITGSLEDPPVPTVVETAVPIPVPVPEGTAISVERTGRLDSFDGPPVKSASPEFLEENGFTDTQRIMPVDNTETREIGGYTFTFEKEK